MEQRAAPMSLSIRIVTSLVIAIVIATVATAVVASPRHPGVWFIPVFLALVCFGCYLFAPVGYALEGDRLIVRSHVHRRTFGPVVRVARMQPAIKWNMWLGVRLFGNGGLFAGTGIYWNRLFGIFRAYVTSARKADLVLVETTGRKILISPERPDEFVESWKTSRPALTPASSAQSASPAAS
jgi:hypothetical protein